MVSFSVSIIASMCGVGTQAVQVEIRWVPAWLLTPTCAGQVRAVLDAAFAGSVEETDWEYALGGMPALALTEPAAGHGRPGGDRGDRDRDRADGDTRLVVGHAALVLRRLYLARGWQVRRGPTAALTSTGIQPASLQDGAVLVWPGPVEFDLDALLTSDWRAGDPW